MYLIDTNVIREARKGERADGGVQRFFRRLSREKTDAFLSVVTIGELQRGIGLIRLRGDVEQAARLERWLSNILSHYADHILDIDVEVAQVWGGLRVPHAQNALDKQIAATALIHGLTVVTRNERHFAQTGADVFNPFDY